MNLIERLRAKAETHYGSATGQLLNEAADAISDHAAFDEEQDERDLWSERWTLTAEALVAEVVGF